MLVVKVLPWLQESMALAQGRTDARLKRVKVYNMYNLSLLTFSDRDVLGTMPNRNNPDCFLFHPVKETIGANDYFLMGQCRKFRN